ncbi:P-loop containing nucleoside triphosphate hydrolase [Pleurotus pulmonarius]
MSASLSRHALPRNLPLGKLSIISSTRFRSSHSSPFANPGSTAFIGSVTSIKQLPELNGLPEVVVIGRANVGKSTFLNAVLGRRDIAHTSKKAGHTRALNFYCVGDEPGQLALVDAPGYGSRGRREWGDLFSAYIASREELRRIYILFNAKHGLKETDKDTLDDDDITRAISTIRSEIFEAAPTCLPPIITSCVMRPVFGIEEARKNIEEVCGLGKA